MREKRERENLKNLEDLKKQKKQKSIIGNVCGECECKRKKVKF